MARGQQGPPSDWVTRAADDALRHARDGEQVTCSSGASPSGPVHLGNLREFLTVHFVADELRRRGVPVRHLHVWDDYDRFRKVPAGVDPSWVEHIGRPLSAVPDPWDCHPSWAEHFKEPLRTALHDLGVDMEEVSQTERYTAGHYRDQVLHSVRHRDDIEGVLARYRTKQARVAESDQEAAALADSVADEEETTGGSDLARFPFKPYCRDCGRDTVTLTSYDDETTDLAYTCECGGSFVTNLATQDEGKLVWKVDWPMRWAVEHVDFEPAGMDHATPGSSFTVGHELVESVFDMPRPAWFGYGFVGFAGVQKMSSSAGGAPTAAEALRVLEAPVLRWLYVRRNPRQTFDIDFGPEVVRLYDEWDALGRKAASGKRDGAVLAHERASATATAGALPTSPVTVPFRVLSSIADVTAGSADQISRLVSHVGYEHDSVSDLEPRLSKAMQWTAEFVPAADRTTVREEPDAASLSALSSQEAEWVQLLLTHLPEGADLELDTVTALVYGVPKLARGLALGDAPTDEVKADQKEFFRLLYHLLVDAERGPRLPTLVVALGTDKVRSLLGG
ncbi:lysine--tRNA ligase [Nocardioides euryhalodurans]|uniref:Lysine--tRNA ligase n=1 Tax=Nocardioides euryhalodurans TaxID=2518370 RepID=A0A4V1BE34_9ACTN|nr:lysine--tRNA ligase [Nocardioides euryhalodurans]QBR93232.1 lysine--tRNA ligase [Nocardioides euryhalodurans]